MNKLPILVGALIIIINAYLHLNAAKGCLDNSWHMEKFPDFKEYHQVECNCPCWKYKQLADRNKCVKCQHYHDPVNRTEQKITSGSYIPKIAVAQSIKKRTIEQSGMAKKKVAVNK